MESYAGALANADIAISCLASGNVHVDATNDCGALDRDANIRFGRAALQAGARHVILVATFEGRASWYFTSFNVAKGAAVDTICATCRQAGAAFTVIRPTACFSDLTDPAFD